MHALDSDARKCIRISHQAIHHQYMFQLFHANTNQINCKEPRKERYKQTKKKKEGIKTPPS